MKQIGVAVVGTGRLGEIAKKTGASTSVADYKQLLEKKDIEAVYISATTEDTHFPMACDFLAAVAAETQRWAKLAKESGATVD